MSKVKGSRFTLVDSPALAPGVDMLTKTSKGPFIDTGYTLKFMEWKTGSRIYLSVDTIKELAAVAGLFDRGDEEIEALVEAAYIKGHLEGLKETMSDDVRNAVDRLGYYADILGAAVRGDEPLVPVEVVEEITGAAALVVEAVEPEPARPARTPRQSNGTSGKRRRADVPAVAGDESLLGV